MLLLNVLQLFVKQVFCYFNTSYVVIKHNKLHFIGVNKANFNTSYVVIKQKLFGRFQTGIRNFNTSYVVIKQNGNGDYWI